MLFGKTTGFCQPGLLGGSGTVALELDAIITETPEYVSTPTKNQVETGADVTDHVALEPEKVTVEGIITNTPVNILKTVGGLLTGELFSDPSSRAFEFIKKLYDDREPFDFVGTLKVYKNMVITSLKIPREPKTGRALSFTMTLEQITLVQSQLFSSNKMAAAVEHTGAKKSNLGAQATQTASSNAAGKGSSMLFKIGQSIGWVR
jgi:hypothetical protein